MDPAPLEEASGSPFLTRRKPSDVQISDKCLERGGTDENKPRDSNVPSPDVATPVLLCHRFGHLGGTSSSSSGRKFNTFA